MDPEKLLVERIRRGLSTIVLGSLPELPRGLSVVRIPCDLPGTLGPLDLARDRIERFLDGGPSPARERERVEASLRRRLLTEEPWRPSDVGFVDACNRLASLAPGRAVVVLDAVDRADAETHRALARIFRERGWLRLPVVLVVRKEPRGSFVEVVEALAPSARESAGKETSAAEPVRVESSRPAAPTLTEEELAPAAALPEGVLRVLRASAVVGATFDAELVARLIDLRVDDVLEALQRARDLGLEIVDRGDGTFTVPEAVTHALAASILPSLRRRYNERLGEMLAKDRPAAEEHARERRPAATRDPLRAAQHLDAAGRREGALEHRLEAAAAMIRTGDVRRAAEVLEGVLGAIDALPAAPLRARLEARARLERARLRWLGAGLEPSFSLDGALAEAFEARAMLGQIASPEIRAAVAATIAGIAYDMGEAQALAQAEAELTDTISLLLQEGATLEAAALLNEQAAIQLRYGHARSASRLLARSRDLFEGRVKEAPDDDKARAELADTEHLIARVPLHAAEDTVDTAAYADALERAKVAETIYRSLGLHRDLARVWETMARLERRVGDVEAARSHFTAALEVEDKIADLTGLARSTAGLAELLAETGKPVEALHLVASSIELNREKASAIGLSFDERALASVERALASRADDEAKSELQRTKERLAMAISQQRRGDDAFAQESP